MYPDENEIRRMAEHVATWTFRHLIQTTNIDRVPSAQIATDAANRYAQALTLAISESQSPNERPLPQTPHIALRDSMAQPIRERGPLVPPVRGKGR